MKINMGFIDRGIRIFLAILIVDLYFVNIISGALAIILLILAIIFIVTSFTGICPVYRLLGISTKKKHLSEKKTK